jgi:hypothetical protein
MDLLTQSLMGAGLAQSGARRDELHMATGIGLVVGLLADADIFIQSSADPLQIEATQSSAYWLSRQWEIFCSGVPLIQLPVECRKCKYTG